MNTASLKSIKKNNCLQLLDIEEKMLTMVGPGISALRWLNLDKQIKKIR